MEQTILDHLASYELSAEDLAVKFDPARSTVTLSGKAPDQPTRERIILCAGIVEGVEHVDD